MKMCYVYSSLDTLIVPCNVIVHFWWPNIQYRAGSSLTAEDMAFSPPFMIKFTTKWRLTENLTKYKKKETTLFACVLSLMMNGLHCSKNEKQSVCWNFPWLLDPATGSWLSLMFFSTEGFRLQIMTRDTWYVSRNRLDRPKLLGCNRHRVHQVFTWLLVLTCAITW